MFNHLNINEDRLSFQSCVPNSCHKVEFDTPAQVVELCVSEMVSRGQKLYGTAQSTIMLILLTPWASRIESCG